jgi:hypothetical protein
MQDYKRTKSIEQPSRLILSKFEMFPDRFSHMKSTRLEYPEIRNQIENSLSSASSTTTSSINNTSSNQLRQKRKLQRYSARYLTQPVTLIEIKESEEDFQTNDHHNNMHPKGNTNNLSDQNIIEIC